MARLHSEAKAGFYATPPGEMALVTNRLTVQPGARLNLLDPCAGKGAALRQMADALAARGAEVKTYGVELEAERAEECRKVLDHVVKGDCFQLRASHGVFSALWLNPPYQETALGERAEVSFFYHLTAPDKYLRQDGLVMFCVPQYVLGPASLALASRLHGLKVYRFTDKNYGAFRQVVVFGYRGKTGRGPQVREIKEWLEEVAKQGPEALPPLDAPDGVTFEVPPAPASVTLFRGAVLDPEEIARDVLASPAWARVEDLLLPPSARRTARLKNPVLPLKLTHYAVAIAAGAVGGHMGTHILEGVTRKVVDRSEEEDEQGRKIKETERHVTTIRVFSREGVFDLA